MTHRSSNDWRPSFRPRRPEDVLRAIAITVVAVITLVAIAQLAGGWPP